RLAAIVAATCTPETSGRVIVFAVNYASLNANSANFFAAKDASSLGHRCLYVDLPLYETEVEKDFRIIDSLQAYYVITQEPSKQQPAPDMVNRLGKAIAERLARDDRFELRTSVTDVLIYARKP